MIIIEQSCLERTQGKNVLIHSRLKDIQIIGQRETFSSQRIPEPRRARNETVDIISFISFHYILITSINDDRFHDESDRISIQNHTKRCFCKISFLLIQLKPLKKICNNMRKLYFGPFSNSFIYCSKLVALACPKHEYLSMSCDQ